MSEYQFSPLGRPILRIWSEEKPRKTIEFELSLRELIRFILSFTILTCLLMAAGKFIEWLTTL